MPCHPLNAETPNNNHHPILKSFPILQILVHITLDSGFRRNDVEGRGSFASFKNHGNHGSKPMSFRAQRGISPFAPPQGVRRMPCHPLNAETPNNNHHPILKSFPILQILVHITLDSGFRRNDVGGRGSFASFKNHGNHGSKPMSFRAQRGISPFAPPQGGRGMPCHPLNAETPNNNHHPILKSFPILQILVHITLDSGFRRNDVGAGGSFASFKNHGNHGSKSPPFAPPQGVEEDALSPPQRRNPKQQPPPNP